MLPEQKSRIAESLRIAAQRVVEQAGIDVDVPSIELERPKQPEHGDLASNLALQLARPLKSNPRAVATQLKDALEALDREGGDAGALIESIEIAGPGFLNLRVRAGAKRVAIRRALADADAFGRGNRGGGREVLVEFVSANPTGPLHVGHGRQGALGDALSALLDADGWRVTREFYYNDAGAQIDNLARSVQARARGLEPDDPRFPVDGYRGEYIRDIAADYLSGRASRPNRWKRCAAPATPTISKRSAASPSPICATSRTSTCARSACASIAITSSRRCTPTVACRRWSTRCVGRPHLRGRGRAVVAHDRVRRRQGPRDAQVRRRYTYFVPDVAYHVAKWERGYARAINVQGSDHHGTIARVRAGLQALDIGIPQGYPDYVMHKMVTVMRGGEEVKISKRAGSYVTLRDLILWTGEVRDDDGEVRIDEQRGRDAVRFS